MGGHFGIVFGDARFDQDGLPSIAVVMRSLNVGVLVVSDHHKLLDIAIKFSGMPRSVFESECLRLAERFDFDVVFVDRFVDTLEAL